jgi:hypothetical protein
MARARVIAGVLQRLRGVMATSISRQRMWLVTGGISVVMGMIAISPDLLDKWTLGGSDQGTWWSMTLPIPQALIHVSMFLSALTFRYVSARSVGDGEYPSEYLDPLVDPAIGVER